MEPVAIVLTTVGWLISTLINKAITTLLEEWVARVGLGKEFETLKNELTQINAMLKTAERHQTTNDALLDMLKDLQQLAYEADDLLDELDYYQIQDNIQLYSSGDSSASQMTGSIGSSSSSSSGFKLASRSILSAFRQGCCSLNRDVEEIHSFRNRITMSSRMNKLIKKLDKNGTSFRRALNLDKIDTIREILDRQATRTNPRETTSRMIGRVFGRDQEQDNLIKLMVGEEAVGKTLSVIAIVGHGGVGKTTLAQSVYNDKSKVKTHFELKMWVTVSVNFDVKRLTGEILQCASGNDYKNIENLDKLQTTLEESLEEKRFLLILDDMWEDKNTHNWKVLLAPLKNSLKKGNVVLVTTRKPGITKLDSIIKSFNLDGLDWDKYWLLFKLYAFGHEMHEGNQNLQDIGRNIARKLKGNPLAAKTVGALLQRDLDVVHWRTVLEREEWKHDDDINSIMPALRISYDYLPIHLQSCFSYCALFPKDFKFPKEFIVNLWIAQSFIHDQRKRLEDIGKKYLDELVDFGFLQRNDKVDEEYFMHGLLHDLAQNVSCEECLNNLDGGEIQEILHTTRHLSISNSGNLEIDLIKVENHLKTGKLSTLIIDGDDTKIEGFPAGRLKDACGLRVLILSPVISNRTLPFRFPLNFIHLRYLLLSSDSRILPRELCHLYHLQVLNVSAWDDLEELPNEFSNLINLRHFDVSKEGLHSLISTVGKLANMQELYKFKVRTGIEYSINQLRELKQLRKLCICDLENVKSMEEAKGAGLFEKPFLNGLHLSWNRENTDVAHAVDADVLDGLQPHPNLKELKITGYSGATFATWSNFLIALEEVHLTYCVACEILPPLGQLPSLKRLYLTSMPFVREIGPDLYGCGQQIPFQCLEVLELRHFANLAKWVWNDQCPSLPALLKLSISDCPQLDFSLSPLYFNEKVTVRLENVELFEYFDLSESKLEIHKPIHAKVWDVVSFQKLRTRPITSLIIHSNQCPLSLEDFSNLVYLEELKFYGCSAQFSFPNNVSQNQSGPQLTTLRVLHFHECDIAVQQLTWVLHHVPKLSYLFLEACHQMKSKINERITAFPVAELDEDEGLLQIPAILKSLQTLCVIACPNMVLASKRGFSELVSLKRLEIRRCRRLVFPSEFEQPVSNTYLLPPGLQKLTLENIPKLATLLLEGLSSLTELSLQGIHRLESLDFSPCVALENLTLGNCPSLASLKGLKSLTHLKHLRVRREQPFAEAWISASEECSFTTLCNLTIGTFSILTKLICRQLISLQQLTIEDKDAYRMTKEQEDALLLLTSLKDIKFFNCNNLKVLPAKLHQLHSLEKLNIRNCKNIRTPPKNGLPKSLRSLNVFWCGPEVAKLFAFYECGPEVEKRVKN